MVSFWRAMARPVYLQRGVPCVFQASALYALETIALCALERRMTTMRKLNSFAFIVAFLCAASVASAQIRGDGRISGKVVDEQGKP